MVASCSTTRLLNMLYGRTICIILYHILTLIRESLHRKITYSTRRSIKITHNRYVTFNDNKLIQRTAVNRPHRLSPLPGSLQAAPIAITMARRKYHYPAA